MASQQGIKQRIKSVKNTRQITKAMQLVAASKLRRAQEAATGPRAYITAARALLSSLAGTPEAHYHPLFESRPINNGLTVVITSDRGLAGAYNSNVNRLLNAHTQNLAVPQQIICIGRYAAMHVARMSNLTEIAAFDIDNDNADITIAQPALKESIDLFLSGKVDAVHLVYTKFISTVKQETVVEQLLPVSAEGSVQMSRTYEPEPEVLLDYAIKRLLEAQVLQAILEARASEHAARMLAMKNATDNAEELIDDLTLAFNNVRQAAITQELAEITAGAEAING